MGTEILCLHNICSSRFFCISVFYKPKKAYQEYKNEKLLPHLFSILRDEKQACVYIFFGLHAPPAASSVHSIWTGLVHTEWQSIQSVVHSLMLPVLYSTPAAVRGLKLHDFG